MTISRGRRTPAQQASLNGLFNAREKGRAAAEDPTFEERDCPYVKYEHRQFWLEGFRSRRSQIAAAELPLA